MRQLVTSTQAGVHASARKMAKTGYVYILASGRNGTLYVGVTSHLVKRTHQHRSGEIGGFTSRYGVKRSVCFETHEEIGAPMAREKAIKKWRRQWKVNLIESQNAAWRDLWPDITGTSDS